MKMKKSDYEAFRVLVQRKAKAMKQSPEIRKKFKKQYDEIVLGLKSNIRSYVAYFITEGKNDLKPKGSLKHCTEIWEKVNDALKVGDLMKLDKECERLKAEYKAI